MLTVKQTKERYGISNIFPHITFTNLLLYELDANFISRRRNPEAIYLQSQATSGRFTVTSFAYSERKRGRLIFPNMVSPKKRPYGYENYTVRGACQRHANARQASTNEYQLVNSGEGWVPDQGVSVRKARDEEHDISDAEMAAWIGKT